jgi:bifunctional non-homologous end joining protein LigD
MSSNPKNLATYRAKRHFGQSPEPRGGKAPDRDSLHFVVQLHAARRLHYDFRLELDGTLKSWAVPKGPSLNPEDKRLAIMVEDHPLEYRNFEGNIPQGNYGAGSVIIWDQGTYEALNAPDKQEGEAQLRAGLAMGHLTFVLNGHKLKGEFALIRLKSEKENEWLLVKKRDAFASIEDVTAKSESVKSHKTLEQIAETSSRAANKTPKSKPSSAIDRKLLAEAPLRPMPHKVRPMLSTLVDKPFDRPGWFFEIKWDGYRAIAEVDKERVHLYSRNQNTFDDKYQPLVQSLKQLGHEAVLDGEVVVLDGAGKPQFHLLQNYQKTKKGHLVYYAFDLLYLDGHDLRKLPLRQRRELLAALIAGRTDLRLSEHFENEGTAFFKAIQQQGLEGMMGKKADSPYREGQRTGEWVKVKTRQRQEAIIAGYTEPKGSRAHLGALVLGVYDKDQLVYVGRVGSGFDGSSLTSVQKRLAPLHQRQSPFKTIPKIPEQVHWIRPELVCEVNFHGWSPEGHLREPIFEGLRDDKDPQSVHREAPKPVAIINHQASKAVTMQPSTDEPMFTNLTKVYWPEDGYTKGDLIEYYRQVAPHLLPYLRDRPESLNRHPNGIHGKNFFQKDMSRQPPPSWVETVMVHSETENRNIKYLVCQNEATLLYMANLGCIEINPWNSRTQAPGRPDYLIIDLDPEKTPFQQVIETAQAVHKQLEKMQLANLCKTSGKRGLHIFVPLAAQYDYDQARSFAEFVAKLVHRTLPDNTSLARSPAQRQQRVYLDFLQNRQGQTLAAPYSVRPVIGATVSTPLKWSEVKRGLDPTRFTMKTIPKRLDKVGDLWKPSLGPGADLATALKWYSKQN